MAKWKRVLWALLALVILFGLYTGYAWMDERENRVCTGVQWLIARLTGNGDEAVEWTRREVPQVFIATRDSVGGKLYKRTGYVPATMEIACDGESTLFGEGSVKVRGNSTAFGPKQPYNFKFDEKQDVLGMGAARKWCLLANCFDPTLMRNYLAMEFAQHLGLAYTSSQCFVELWMDGSYKGCYVLMEPVEVKSTRVDIDPDDGDFLIEYEREREEDDVTYVTTSNGMRFAISEPEEPTEAQQAEILSALEEAIDVLEGGDYAQVMGRIDVDSFARYLLLNELFKPKDFEYSSVFFYFQDGVLHAGPAWDYDLSTGNSNPPEVTCTDGLYASKAHWYPLLMAYPEFRQSVAELYEAEQASIAELYGRNGRIDALRQEYADVFARNFEEAGWDVTELYSTLMRRPDRTFDQNVSFLQSWLRDRDEWLRQHWTAAHEG